MPLELQEYYKGWELQRRGADEVREIAERMGGVVGMTKGEAIEWVLGHQSPLPEDVVEEKPMINVVKEHCCGNCYHYKDGVPNNQSLSCFSMPVSGEYGLEGLCRAHPPVTVGHQSISSFRSMYPRVKKSWCCGEWKNIPIE